MALINQNSIIGVTSITSPSASNVLTFHTNDTTERLRVSTSGVSFSGTNASLDTSGNLTIAGVLTYEDVTSVDSVGLSTFQNGIHVTGGSVGIGSDNPTDVVDILTGGSDEVTSLKVKAQGRIELSRNHSDAPYIKTLMNSGNPNIILGDSGGDKVLINGDGSSYFNGGNIGIGTDNPQDTLDVASAVPQIRLTDLSDGSYGQVRANGGNLILRADEGNTVADSVILAEIDGDEKVRISSSGNVGIGTDNPDHKLRVDYTSDDDGFVINNTSRGGKFRIATSGANAENLDVRRYDSANSTYRRFLLLGPDQFSVYTGFTTSSTERLRINQNGCLQVGEPSGTPSEVMQLRKVSGDTEVITYANTGYKTIFNCTGSDRFALESGYNSVFEVQDATGNGIRKDLRFDGTLILNRGLGDTSNSAVQLSRIIGCDGVSLANGMAILVSQTDTISGRAARISTSNNNGTAFYGPYGAIHPGSYTAMFHMKVSNNSNTSTFIRIDIAGSGIAEAGGYGAHRPIALDLAPSHFDTSNRYQYIGLDFNQTSASGYIEVRGLNYNNSRGADLYLDHILIVPRIPSHDG